MRIDAHHHVWTLSKQLQAWMTPAQEETIGRDFSLKDWSERQNPRV